jgi:selenium donor protein
VLVGPGAADDAGVFLLDGRALVATADFITPVCDDPRLFGRVAAANSLSDVYAMGGRPLFALNLCCFPSVGVPDGVFAEILAGAADALEEAGAALLGGHSVADPELKFGLAVVGEADRDRLLTNDRALPGDRLLLTKPLGSGVLINAFKADKLGEEGLRPALDQMARLNAEASRLALEHGARAATDITGFGFAGHALNVARGSGVRLSVRFADLPAYEEFSSLVKAGISTGCTVANWESIEASFVDRVGLDPWQRELLVDPQTSGGLLLTVPAASAVALLDALLATGHQAAEIGEALPGPARLEIV